VEGVLVNARVGIIHNEVKVGEVSHAGEWEDHPLAGRDHCWICTRESVVILAELWGLHFEGHQEFVGVPGIEGQDDRGPC